MKACLCLIALLLVMANGSLYGQSISQRIEQLKHRRVARPSTTSPNSPAVKINKPLRQKVQLDNVTAREAFAWWAKASNISLLINWNILEQEGIDPQSKIMLTLSAGIPARVVLLQLIEQASAEVPLFYEITPWFIEIMTRRQLNRKTVVRIYDVKDLLMKIPNFGNAPNFNLSAALASSSGGSSGSSTRGTSGGGLFGNQNANKDHADTGGETSADRGEQLAQLIRDTIEPDVWVSNGGLHSTIKYYNGRLIIRAPRYVQDQIGLGRRMVRPVKRTAKRPIKSVPVARTQNSDVSTVQAKTARKKVSRQAEQ